MEQWAYAVGGVLMDEQPDDALPAFRAFEKWATSELGPNNPAVAQAVARQAWCEARLGHRVEACRLYERSLGLVRAQFGDDHPAAMEISAYLESNCGPAARLNQSEVSATEAGPHTLEGLPRFNPLKATGDWTLALEDMERAARDMAGRLGITDLSQTVGDADEQGFNVGKLFREIGEFELAIETFEEYERWASAKYGPEHNYVVQALHQLAHCHWEVGAYSEACRLNQRTIDLVRKTEPDNPYIQVLEKSTEERCPPVAEQWLFGLAQQLCDADRFEEAPEPLEAYERWAEREHGAQHRYVLESIALRGYAHECMGDMEEACRLHRQVLAMAPEADTGEIPVEDLETFVAEHCGAADDDADPSGRVPLGERWDIQTLAEIEPYLESVGDTLVTRTHYDEAASAYAAAQAWVERTEGPDDPDVARLLANRAWCHVQTGEQELACRLYERAMRMTQASDQPDEEFLSSTAAYLVENCR
jgi:tetratricopeptide (TPR) repeat protein